MNTFNYPPPPPPPAPQGAPSQPSRGNQSNNRGGRGRGRGNAPAGSYRGGFNQSRGRSPYNPPFGATQTHTASGYPLPTYPDWQHSQNTNTAQPTRWGPPGAGLVPGRAGWMQTANHPQSAHMQLPPQSPQHQAIMQYPPYAQHPQHQPYVPTAATSQHPSSSFPVPSTHSNQTRYLGYLHPLPAAPQSASVPSLTVLPPLRYTPNNGHQSTISNTRGNPQQNYGKRKRDFPRGGTSRVLSQQGTAPGFSPTPLGPPGTQASPGVPSFGFVLPSKLPPGLSHHDNLNETGQIKTKRKKNKHKKRKQNALGLTPSGPDHEDSEEEDIDEEDAYKTKGEILEFNHKGQTFVLSNSADLAAYLAERKRCFPTRANIAAKQAAEKKKRQEQADRQRQINQQRAAAQRSSVNSMPQGARSSKPEPIPDDPQLRIEYFKRQLRLAEEAALDSSLPTGDTLSREIKTEFRDIHGQSSITNVHEERRVKKEEDADEATNADAPIKLEVKGEVAGEAQDDKNEKEPQRMKGDTITDGDIEHNISFVDEMHDQRAKTEPDEAEDHIKLEHQPNLVPYDSEESTSIKKEHTTSPSVTSSFVSSDSSESNDLPEEVSFAQPAPVSAPLAPRRPARQQHSRRDQHRPFKNEPKEEPRKSLYEVFVEKEILEEARPALEIIKRLGDEGFLHDVELLDGE